MHISPIKNQCDYRKVLKAIEGLMSAKRNTPEGDRLDVLVTLVEAWERKHYPMAPGPGGGDQVPYGPEWAAAPRPHPLPVQHLVHTVTTAMKALADAKNDLATA